MTFQQHALKTKPFSHYIILVFALVLNSAVCKIQATTKELPNKSLSTDHLHKEPNLFVL